VHFAVGTRPQRTGIDVSSLWISRDRLQHYLGDITQHLLVYIPLGSVIGCGIPSECGRHWEKGKQNLHEVAAFVPYRGMDIPNGQVDRAGFLVAGDVRELRLVRSTDQGNNCCPRGSLSCVSHHQSAEFISDFTRSPSVSIVWVGP
jgi:hypothetical protein